MKIKLTSILIAFIVFVISFSALLLTWLNITDQVSVIVPKDNIATGTRITKKMLASKSIHRNDLENSSITKYNQIVGLYTKNDLEKGFQISTTYLQSKYDKYSYLADLPENKRAFPLPTELLSTGGDIKENDIVDIYIYKKKNNNYNSSSELDEPEEVASKSDSVLEDANIQVKEDFIKINAARVLVVINKSASVINKTQSTGVSKNTKNNNLLPPVNSIGGSGSSNVPAVMKVELEEEVIEKIIPYLAESKIYVSNVPPSVYEDSAMKEGNYIVN